MSTPRSKFVPCWCPEHEGKLAHYKHRQRVSLQLLNGLPMSMSSDSESDNDPDTGSDRDNIADGDSKDDYLSHNHLEAPRNHQELRARNSTAYQLADPHLRLIYEKLAQFYQDMKPTETTMANFLEIMRFTLTAYLPSSKLEAFPNTVAQLLRMFKSSTHDFQRIPVCPGCGILVDHISDEPSPDFKCPECSCASVFRYMRFQIIFLSFSNVITIQYMYIGDFQWVL
jgi:predicted RNA-binding Zn-ribbon protein involved in translation (DUF1610 family)